MKISGIRGIDGIKGIRGIKGIEGIEGIKGKEGIEGIKGKEDIQGMKDIEPIEYLKDIKRIAGTKGMGVVNGRKGIEGLCVPCVCDHGTSRILYSRAHMDMNDLHFFWGVSWVNIVALCGESPINQDVKRGPILYRNATICFSTYR